MANKNKGKVIQMLSPENYIRKKARSLPIHECWINADWEDSGMANIVIARIHSNENITFCIYLVDLLCLGVKDTHFKFNVSETEYRDFLENMEDRMEIEAVDYVLVHNIILSGVEFAEEFGFKPHKEFTSITEFMLEEDNNDIELMEIECGRNGKPLYVQGPYDSEATVNKIMKQLEHSAGRGNYDFIKEGISDFEDDDELEDLIEEMTLEEKGEKFKQYYNRLEKLKVDEFKDFLELLQSVVDDFTDVEEYNNFYNELKEELTSIKIEKDIIPTELLGINDESYHISDDIKQAFLSILSDGALKQKKKQFKEFSKNKGVDAAIDYLEALISGLDRSRKYEPLLKKAAVKYPNYAILQLKWTKYQMKQNDNPQQLPHYPCKFENFFNSRQSIHSWEYFCFLDIFTHLVLLEKNFAKIDALKTVINEMDIQSVEFSSFNSLISMFQTEIIASKFSI